MFNTRQLEGKIIVDAPQVVSQMITWMYLYTILQWIVNSLLLFCSWDDYHWLLGSRSVGLAIVGVNKEPISLWTRLIWLLSRLRISVCCRTTLNSFQLCVADSLSMLFDAGHVWPVLIVSILYWLMCLLAINVSRLYCLYASVVYANTAAFLSYW